MTEATMLGEMTADMQALARKMAQQHKAQAEEATRQLLSRWVSGLEPTIAYDQEYRVIGISHGGQIVLRS